MKWLFIFLLLINVVYFGWELDRQTQIEFINEPIPLNISEDVKKLVLLRELETPPVSRKTQVDESKNIADDVSHDDRVDQITEGTEEKNSSHKISTDVMIEKEFSDDLVASLPEINDNSITGNKDSERTMCFSYGPFPDNKQAGDLKDWFEQREVLVKQRVEKEQKKRLFWIYLSPLESRENAIAAIEDLKNKGIKDYRLIDTGDLRNAISLGLFSTQAIVNKRLNDLKNKGYKPIVVPYHDAKVIYWIDVTLVNQKELLNEMFLEFPSRFNSVPMNCSEIALH